MFNKSLIIFLTIGLSIAPVDADVFPQLIPLSQTKAPSTRSCPIPQGELFLFGTEVDQEQQIVLKVNATQPLLLYQVVSENPEKIILTVTDVKGKLDRTLIFEKELTTLSSNYSAVRLPKLDPNKKYLLTLALLCQDRPQNAKPINAWLTIVDEQTPVNDFIRSRNVPEVD